ncbi:MAG: hypothetical protein JWN57_367 [Frankiales bacterium]|nr:hypothetical protein [Frankiales bacterium]
MALTRRVPALLMAVALLAACAGGGDDAPDRRPDRAAATSPPASASPPAVAPAASPRSQPPLSFQNCGGGFACATMPVPLTDADPSKGTVDLAVVRKPARRTAARIGSLVVNPGGPGASAVDYLRAAYEGLPDAVLDRFDLVAFDPRGVGRSAPVRCASTGELDRYFALDPTPDDAEELKAFQQGNADFAAGCAERSGPVLAYLSTRDAAGDMDRLRQALGEKKLTYLGYSYGTSIGAAYLDRWPTRVRAMVLDGAIDPALRWDQFLEGQSRGFDVALRAFLANCQQRSCAFRQTVRGDLGQAFDALAARIDRDPLPGRGSRRVGPGEFTLAVGSALYSREYGWPVLAEALAAAQRGEGAALLELSDGYLERGDRGYANLIEALTAVSCLDRPWPKDLSAYQALARKVARDSPRFGPAIALSSVACASWPVPPAGTPRRVTAPGAPPVLVIGTTRDPATPYSWSVALAGQLETGVLLTYDGDGHTVYRAGAPSCVTSRVDAYLLTGKVTSARCA